MELFLYLLVIGLGVLLVGKIGDKVQVLDVEKFEQDPLLQRVQKVQV